MDELIVVPEAAFELVSDTDSEFDLIMVDDETSTDFLQSVEAGTQTTPVSADDRPGSPSSCLGSMTESTGSRGVGEVIKSMVQNQGFKLDMPCDSSQSKHLVSIGINTVPSLTFEKETCTPIRHLFSKGTMTFFVSKMDKSTSTFNQARIITGSSLTKTKSEDKITMTAKPEKKDVGVETEPTAMDGRITKCISKLRSVSEKLNSPPARKAADHETFFGTNFSPSRSGADGNDRMSSPGTPNGDKPEEERQRQLKTLLEQTNALLRSKDRSPMRKPQPITTLKVRQPVPVESGPSNTGASGNATFVSSKLLKPDDAAFYDSRSLPRGMSYERPGVVRMGSQPLSPSRLPLLRYNSAPGRIATVPTQTLLKKPCQTTPILGRCPSPRLSPSKIPITKKPSPPDYPIKQQQQQSQPIESISQDALPIIPPLRRPLPSITETRTPSSCSDSSTTSYISAESVTSVGPSSNRLSTDSTAPSAVSSRLSSGSVSQAPICKKLSLESPPTIPLSSSNSLSADSSSSSKPVSNRLSVESATTPTSASDRLSVDSVTVPSRSPSATTSLSSVSASLTDSVFKKSSSDLHSPGSSETLEEKKDEKSTTTPTKKSGMGFMQRLLSRKKKPQEGKKEPVSVVKAGPTTAAAVAALASAAPPLPAPAPESHAIAHLQHPPHHYPPLPEHCSPSLPRKPRPFVYVQQRIVSIQQDNVEEMVERKAKPEDARPDEEQTSGKETLKDKDKSEKQKDAAKRDAQNEKEKKKKKDEKDKEKAKAKVSKTKTKKNEDKSNPPLSSKKDDAVDKRTEK